VAPSPVSEQYQPCRYSLLPSGSVNGRNESRTALDLQLRGALCENNYGDVLHRRQLLQGSRNVLKHPEASCGRVYDCALRQVAVLRNKR
jgi:hypothetical protein